MKIGLNTSVWERDLTTTFLKLLKVNLWLSLIGLIATMLDWPVLLIIIFTILLSLSIMMLASYMKHISTRQDEDDLQ